MKNLKITRNILLFKLRYNIVKEATWLLVVSCGLISEIFLVDL